MVYLIAGCCQDSIRIDYDPAPSIYHDIDIEFYQSKSKIQYYFARIFRLIIALFGGQITNQIKPKYISEIN